jgi:Fe2+ or Zn2+ uptake regulation protein
MYKNENGLSWREQAVLNFILEASDGIVTREVYSNVKMSKATALKSLAVLEAKGLIYHEMVGPSKTWHIQKRCEKCDSPMEPHIVYRCGECNKNLYIPNGPINIMEPKDDRWDNLFGALQNADAYVELRKKGFMSDDGLTETGLVLKGKMEDIYSA